MPTRIEKLKKLSKASGGPDIYIKRDDQTGTELSGNKVRKLEYSIREALDNGCDYLITCGGIQSNHCRATAAAAAKLGMKSCLVLRGTEASEPEGNLLLDRLLGAEIRFITAEEYSVRRGEIMEAIKREMEHKGFRPYIIPEGASNGIGSFGYYTAMEEILAQEKEMNIHFDCIVLATGSGGTYSGLWLANKLHGNTADIYGIIVGGDVAYFKERIPEILRESMGYMAVEIPVSADEINLVGGYVGRGYALSRPEELEFIRELAGLEGIILDPVYTGKAMYGLTSEIKKGTFDKYRNILFVHTGGLYGLFPQGDLFEF
ncbi:MAG TPA: D-cysteine desulfhydrase family protein [Clostridia bacterium]|nr:D-cysteine desulfhydrase family protein [Clostridia bacterium]